MWWYWGRMKSHATNSVERDFICTYINTIQFSKMWLYVLYIRTYNSEQQHTTNIRRLLQSRKAELLTVSTTEQITATLHDTRNDVLQPSEYEIRPLPYRVAPMTMAARLKRGSVAARFLGLRFWIPPGAWMSLCCKYCVCVGLITYP